MLLSPNDFPEKDLSLDQIFLDPNNPRFASEKDVITPEEKIIDPTVQELCAFKMQKYELEELKKSIKEVGFVPVDRIVVKPLKAKADSYVVLEGNRRIAALKTLAKENAQGVTPINAEVLKTILNFKVFVYVGGNLDMAWISQGIRHSAGYFKGEI